MKKKLVLVVEDDRSISEILSEFLEMHDFECKALYNGLQALTYLTERGKVPDVILLDLMMPVCSGYDFLNQLKNYPQFITIPIVTLSAAADAKETAQKYGVTLIRKPFLFDDLLTTLERAIKT